MRICRFLKNKTPPKFFGTAMDRWKGSRLKMGRSFRQWKEELAPFCFWVTVSGEAPEQQVPQTHRLCPSFTDWDMDAPE